MLTVRIVVAREKMLAIWTRLFMECCPGYLQEIRRFEACELDQLSSVKFHGAIVAREYGIPAVLGVRSATETFKDGQVVEVNGNSGTVTVLTISTPD